MYPEPKGKSYTQEALSDPAVVEEVFDFCQIMVGTISAEGWQFLFTHYTLEALAKIDMKSGWFQPCTDELFRESIELMSLIAGYNPNTRELGKYDEKTRIFIAN